MKERIWKMINGGGEDLGGDRGRRRGPLTAGWPGPWSGFPENKQFAVPSIFLRLSNSLGTSTEATQGH